MAAKLLYAGFAISLLVLVMGCGQAPTEPTEPAATEPAATEPEVEEVEEIEPIAPPIPE